MNVSMYIAVVLAYWTACTSHSFHVRTLDVRQILAETDDSEVKVNHFIRSRRQVSDDCDYVTEAVTVSVPYNYDGFRQYPLTYHHCFVIHAPEQQTVHLEILAMDIEHHYECDWDWLDVYDGPDDTDDGSRIAHLCGTNVPDEPLATQGQWMYLSFVSDGYGRRTGFTANVQFRAKTARTTHTTTSETTPSLTEISTAAYEDDETVCGELSGTVEITSHESGPSYADNSYRCWLYSAPEGQFAQIAFTQFHIEPHIWCNYDHLTVYNGDYADDNNVIGRFCGSDAPGTYQGNNNHLYIVFTSDHVYTYPGFTATLSAVAPPEVTGFPSCGAAPINHDVGLIINGVTSHSGQWPWAVDILLRGYESSDVCRHQTSSPTGGSIEYRTHCGGTIVQNNWVVTAAHCVYQGSAEFYTSSELKVLAGEHNRRVHEGTEKFYSISRVVVHPMYATSDEHDIALLQLSEPIVYTDYIRPACLHHDRQRAARVGDYCYSAGWGDTRPSADHEETHDRCIMSHVLQRIQDPEACEIQEVNVFNERVICMWATGEVGTCSGDSGGGLMCQDPVTGRFYLDGVNTFSFRNTQEGIECDNRLPTGSINVTGVMQWIEDNTAGDFPVSAIDDLL